MKIGIISGGFDPIHAGHIALIDHAATLCGHLIVGLNSDEWLTRKKGKPFQTFDERCTILQHISGVDEVRGFMDHDDTANHLLQLVRSDYMTSPILFMNGGDRGAGNIPEVVEADRLHIEICYGIGGHTKMNSSSKLLSEWSSA